MALAHRVDLRQANRIRMAGRRPVRVIMAISCRRARSGDLELNWGRIGHVTRKRMRHPCNLLANIIRTLANTVPSGDRWHWLIALTAAGQQDPDGRASSCPGDHGYFL